MMRLVDCLLVRRPKGVAVVTSLVAALAKPQVRLGAASLSMALGLGAYAAMTHLQQAVWAGAYGPICGHGLGQPHCAACYAALIAAGAGVGLLLTGWRSVPTRAWLPGVGDFGSRKQRD
jgi:hypothetical protein